MRWAIRPFNSSASAPPRQWMGSRVDVRTRRELVVRRHSPERPQQVQPSATGLVTPRPRGRCDEASSDQKTNKKALAIHVSGLLYDTGVPQRPGTSEYHRLRRGNLMQIKEAEA